METAPDKRATGGPSTGLLILIFGAVEVAIVYALLAFDTPVSSLAWRATESWPGRLTLAGIGLAVIVVSMITILTFAERRQRRQAGRRND